MTDIGLGGMIRTAAWLDTVVGMETLSIGRSALAKEDCALELCGSQLLVRITIKSTWIWIYACSLDEGQPEFLFNIGDGPEGWITVRRFVAALERSGIKSLSFEQRPIEFGEGSNCFVIG